MDFELCKVKVWEASRRTKAHLKAFFSSLLRGKLGKNMHHGLEKLAEAGGKPVLHCTEHGVSSYNARGSCIESVGMRFGTPCRQSWIKLSMFLPV